MICQFLTFFIPKKLCESVCGENSNEPTCSVSDKELSE